MRIKSRDWRASKQVYSTGDDLWGLFGVKGTKARASASLGAAADDPVAARESNEAQVEGGSPRA